MPRADLAETAAASGRRAAARDRADLPARTSAVAAVQRGRAAWPKRAALAEARSAREAVAREAGAAAPRASRRSPREREAWTAARRRRRGHLEELAARLDDVETERAALLDAPDEIVAAPPRPDVERPSTRPRRRAEAADRLAAGRGRTARPLDSAPTAALQALSEAREARAAPRSGWPRRADAATRSPRRSRPLRGAALRAHAPWPGSRTTHAARPRRARDAGSSGCSRSASGSAPSISGPRRRQPRSRRGCDALVAEREDLIEAIRRLRHGIHSLNREGRERLLAAFERGQRPFPAPVHAPVRRRHGGAAARRIRRSAGGRPRNPRPPAGQEAADHDAALRRRAGADRDGADLRGVPHQSGADLRARRGRRAARRRQCRALLRPARRDGPHAPTRASSSSPTTRSPWRG